MSLRRLIDVAECHFALEKSSLSTVANFIKALTPPIVKNIGIFQKNLVRML